MGVIRGVFVAFGSIGLAGASVAHAAWGMGVSWPMRTRAELAEVVVGDTEVPPPAACFAVAGLTAGAAGLVAGLGGNGTVATGARWALAAGLASRGILGGRVAGKLLGMRAPSDRFVELDDAAYRPLFLALASAAAVSARR